MASLIMGIRMRLETKPGKSCTSKVSTTASMARSASGAYSVPDSMRPIASSISSCEMRSFSTERERFFSIASRPFSMTPSSTSARCTTRPAWAATWAIPLPICPAPTTCTFSIAKTYPPTPVSLDFTSMLDLHEHSVTLTPSRADGRQAPAPAPALKLVTKRHQYARSRSPYRVAQRDRPTIYVHHLFTYTQHPRRVYCHRSERLVYLHQVQVVSAP